MSELTARQFNQDVSAAKRAAADEPVVITDRGRPSHVLLSFEEYQHLTGARRDVVDWLSLDEDIDFEPERLEIVSLKPDL